MVMNLEWPWILPMAMPSLLTSRANVARTEVQWLRGMVLCAIADIPKDRLSCSGERSGVRLLLFVTLDLTFSVTKWITIGSVAWSPN